MSCCQMSRARFSSATFSLFAFRTLILNSLAIAPVLQLTARQLNHKRDKTRSSGDNFRLFYSEGSVMSELPQTLAT